MKYTCSYCRKQFSRAWNRYRHVRIIHREYKNQDFNPRIVKENEFQTMRPTLAECEPNVINPENIHGSYQEESTNDYTGVIGGENILPRYIYQNRGVNNFQYEPDINFDNDEKIESRTLLFIIELKLRIIRRLLHNPYSYEAKRMLIIICASAYVEEAVNLWIEEEVSTTNMIDSKIHFRLSLLGIPEIIPL